MNAWDHRTETLLAEARRLRPPGEAKRLVRQRLAASIALSTVAGATLSAKAAPLVGANLASAVKAGCAVAPGLTSGAAMSTPLLFLTPVTVGLALGLSAMTPSAVETPRPSVIQGQPQQRSTPTPHQATAPQSSFVTTTVPTPPMEQPSNTPPSTAHAPPALARQSELLEHARLVLRQGDPTLALRSIDAYRKEFPSGVFFFEALTLQASALCKLGRYDEGRNILRRLEASGVLVATLAQTKAHCDEGQTP
jgi:hypothetical protein